MKRIQLWVVLAVLAVCAAYANSFENGFHFDDFHTVADNPAIRSLHNVGSFFTDARTFSVLPANRTYRPIVSASLALDYALGHGYDLFWFHLSVFLVFLLLLALLWMLYARVLEVTAARAGELQDAGSRQAVALWALGAAAWFGLHPAMAETVNYVIQRGDIFCTVGCVGALVLWAWWPAGRRWGVYLLPLVFALLSKPPAAVFPALLLLYVFFFEAEGTAAQRWKRSAIAMLPSLAVTAALMVFESHMTPKTFLPAIISAADYRRTQPLVLLRYVGEFFLPLHLNVDTDLPAYHAMTAGIAAGWVMIVAMGGAVWAASRRRAWYPVAFGLLWFVITELPTSLYALSEVENDHRMFFAFPGLMLAAVWTLRWMYRRVASSPGMSSGARIWLRTVGVLAALFALTGYAWGVHVRNRVWHTEDSLWRDDAQKSPHNGRGLMIYGLTLMNHGDYAGALAEFNQALLYTPNYATLEINLGVVYGAMGQQVQAEQHFLRAIALDPLGDDPHTYYGRWLLEQGRVQEAVAQLQEAVRLNPARPLQHDLLISALEREGDTVGAKSAALATLQVVPGDAAAENVLQHPGREDAAFWINLSLSQYRAGQYTASIVSARKALELDANSAEAYNNIGADYGAMGQWDEGIANERTALRLEPTLQIAKNNLAYFLQQKPQAGRNAGQEPADVVTLINRSLALNQAGKYKESIAAARAALRIDPRCAEAWNNVAAGDEALHRWDEAIAAAKKAVALQPDFQLAKNNLAWAQQQKATEQAKR